jgi:two-component system, NtrC family, sensor histidine kinase KinB
MTFKGGAMNMKKKLSLGLGFLFFIIIAIAFFSSYYIQKLSRDSENILKNNYDTIVYSKKMIVALDDIMASINIQMNAPSKDGGESHYSRRLFESGKAEFDRNLKAENNNITEIQEKEYVDTLNRFYESFLALCRKIQAGQGTKALYVGELLPSYEKLRYTLIAINDLNMQAVVRKNRIMKHDSRGIIISMSLIGAVCIVLAFAYFWYFPFYISNSLMFLSNKARGLVEKAGMTLDIDSDDEFHVMLRSLDLLEKNSGGKKAGRGTGRK